MDDFVCVGFSGFISIDCGSSSNYTDTRGIQWSTDAGYIATGTNADISVSGISVDNEKQLSTARYFPSSRKRFCYVLPGLVNNASYLIRASFLYGDLIPSVPSDYSFQIAIDSNIVGTVTYGVNNGFNVLTEEFFVVTTSKEVAFCLLPSVGIPFISSLELRPLELTMYSGYMFLNQIGRLTRRLKCGANNTDLAIR